MHIYDLLLILAIVVNEVIAKNRVLGRGVAFFLSFFSFLFIYLLSLVVLLFVVN